jgi:hypothetical protein
MLITIPITGVKSMNRVRNSSSMPKWNEALDIKLIQDGWVSIEGPKKWSTACFVSVPFMVINVLISIITINIFSNISLQEFGYKADGSVSTTIYIWDIFFVILLVSFHELLHFIFIPNFMKSQKTYMGFTLFGGYVVTEEEIPKIRFLLITIAPFFIISVLSPFLFGALGILTLKVKVLILLNSIASSVDTLTIFLILKQAPPNSILRGNGLKKYWKYEPAKSQT